MHNWDSSRINERVELVYRRAMDFPLQAHRDSTWYYVAHSWIKSLSLEHKRDYRRIAAVVAVLSPQSSWKSQLRYIPVLLSQLSKGVTSPAKLKHPGFRANKRKAMDIWHAETLADAERYVRGQKVNSFYLNLCGCDSSVTVDAHMVDIALGIGRVADRKSFGVLTAKRYKIVADAIRLVSGGSPFTAPALQALLWKNHKRTMALKQKRKEFLSDGPR
jgi:hypothetical protein